MYYVYLLKSKKDQTTYIGFCSNLKKRVREHNQGKTKSTKAHTPYKLVYYEAYQKKVDATQREWKLKHNGQDREKLKARISNI